MFSYIQSKLSIKLILLLLGILLPGYLLFNGVIYKQAEQLFADQAYDNLQRVIDIKEQQLEDWNKQIFNDLDLIGHVLFVSATRNEIEFSGEFRAQLRTKLEHIIAERPAFTELFLLDAEGQLIVSSDPSQEGRQFADQAFFRHGKLDPYAEQFFLNESENAFSSIFSVPIHTENSGWQGVLVGRIEGNAVGELLQHRESRDSSETYLVNAEHYAITPLKRAAPGEWPQTVASTMVDRCLGYDADQTNEEQFSDKGDDYSGVPVFGYYEWLPDMGVCLASEVDQSEALATLSQVMLTFNILYGAIILLLTAGAFMSARFITDNLNNLIK